MVCIANRNSSYSQFFINLVDNTSSTAQVSVMGRLFSDMSSEAWKLQITSRLYKRATVTQ